MKEMILNYKRKILNIVHGQSNAIYDAGFGIIYNKEVLKANLFNYNDAYILVRGDVTITRHQVTQVAFTNDELFIKCITKIDETKIDEAEDLDLVMPIYNLIECNWNYSEITGSLLFCCKDEATNFNTDIANSNFKSFEYKTKLSGNIEDSGANGNWRNATIVVPLKDLKNFWRSLEMSLINCKIELKFK